MLDDRDRAAFDAIAAELASDPVFTTRAGRAPALAAAQRPFIAVLCAVGIALLPVAAYTRWYAVGLAGFVAATVALTHLLRAPTRAPAARGVALIPETVRSGVEARAAGPDGEATPKVTNPFGLPWQVAIAVGALVLIVARALGS